MSYFTPILDWLVDHPILGIDIGIGIRLVICWARYNWKVLHNNKKRDSIKTRLKWLEQDRYGVLYTQALGWLLGKTAGVIGDPERFPAGQIQAPSTTDNKQGWVTRCFGFNPWSETSYRFSLVLAVFYPILAFFIFWAAGADGSFGDGSGEIFMPNISIEWRWLVLIGLLSLLWGLIRVVKLPGKWRYLTSVALLGMSSLIIGYFIEENPLMLLLQYSIGFCLQFIPLYCGGIMVGFIVHRSIKPAHREINNLAFIFTFIGIFTGVILAVVILAGTGVFTDPNAGVGAIAVAMVIVIAVVGIVAGVVAGVVAGIVVFTAVFTMVFDTIEALGVAFDVAIVIAIAIAAFVAGITIVATNTLYASISTQKRGIYWLSYTLFFLSIAYLGLKYAPSSGTLFISLFCLLLPLISAPLDWLSLGITRGLLQAIRSGHHASWQALLWALADILLAVVLLLLITVLSVMAIEMANGITGRIVLNLRGDSGVLAGIRSDAGNINYYWIYFALFSTLVPTLVHMALAGGAATLWAPKKLRRWIVTRFEDNHDATLFAWAYISFTPVVGFVLLPGSLLYGVWYLLGVHGDDGKQWLLDFVEGWALLVARWFL